MNAALRLLLLATCALAAQSAGAQGYPVKPVRFVVGFAAGSTTDLIGRVIEQKMSEGLGQPALAENRPGAGSNVAYEFVSKAAPDGYTVLLANAGLATGATAYVKLNFNALRDFAPISQITATPHILVIHPSLPVKNVKELTAFAKAHPGQLNFASTGHGNSDHLAAALYSYMTGLDMVHVPYKGGPIAMGDVVTGQVAIYFAGVPVALPFIQSGRVRALAVTSSKRSSAVPDVPTMNEAGVKGYEHMLWQMFLVPAATPKEIVARLHRETDRALQSADVRDRLAKMGVDIVGSTPEQAGAYLKSEIAKYAKVVKAIGLRLE